MPRREDVRQLAAEFSVHAGEVTVWKKQLLEEAPGLFEDGRNKRVAERPTKTNSTSRSAG